MKSIIFRRGVVKFIIFATMGLAGIAWWRLDAQAQERSLFPEGYDAVQTAPNSHKIIFENTFVRVLEVPIPAIGQPEPLHHHRWPSLFLHWDTGGKSPHIAYHRPDGSVRDIPSKVSPRGKGHWVGSWMAPEPLHWVETLDYGDGQEPPYLRVEFKMLLE